MKTTFIIKEASRPINFTSLHCETAFCARSNRMSCEISPSLDRIRALRFRNGTSRRAQARDIAAAKWCKFICARLPAEVKDYVSRKRYPSHDRVCGGRAGRHRLPDTGFRPAHDQ